jgi:hypothetical protein
MAELSPLRRRMIEDMTIRNMSPATQRSYISAVSKFGRSPDKLTLDDVHAFQVHLVSTGGGRLPRRAWRRRRNARRRRSGSAQATYRLAHAGHLGRIERRVMSAIVACRTAALGGHVEACDDCGVARVAYNSCLMGGSSNVELAATRSRSCVRRRQLGSPLRRALRSAISLSDGWNAPRRRCGGTIDSMTTSFSVGSPRV